MGTNNRKKRRCKGCSKYFKPISAANIYCPECRKKMKKLPPKNSRVYKVDPEKFIPTENQVKYTDVHLLTFGQNLTQAIKANMAGVHEQTASSWFCKPQYENFRKWFNYQMEKRLQKSTAEVLDALVARAKGEAKLSLEANGEIIETDISANDQNKAAELYLKAQGALIERQVSKVEKKSLIKAQLQAIPSLEDLNNDDDDIIGIPGEGGDGEHLIEGEEDA